MNEYAAIMPEREIITAAWDMVKVYKDYPATEDDTTTAQLLQAMEKLHDMGNTPAQKKLAQGLAHSLMDYFTAKAEAVTKP